MQGRYLRAKFELDCTCNIYDNFIYITFLEVYMQKQTKMSSYLFYNQVFYFAFIVDKCAKCDSHARCDNGNCVCMEGWVGDGQTCSPKEGGGRK